uniref:carboxypeptidase inhibitor SmCI-like n=1 Tax=Styela clava TaxID=7725 RepID=UPI001939CAF2|nr:carboxypeptidase inhibitor SmCI-like [Styela clava]
MICPEIIFYSVFAKNELNSRIFSDFYDLFTLQRCHRVPIATESNNRSILHALCWYKLIPLNTTHAYFGSQNMYWYIKSADMFCQILLVAFCVFITLFSEGIASIYQDQDVAAGKCESRTCQSPKDPGPCKAYMPRYYFNGLDQTCKKFIYGGCLGNSNRFGSLMECYIYCQPAKCFQPKPSRPCSYIRNRWYYDAKECKCKRAWWWTECVPSENNFLTESDCLNQCYYPLKRQESDDNKDIGIGTFLNVGFF